MRLFLVLTLAALTAAGGAAEPEPLPSTEAFLAAARETMQPNPAYRQYRYQQRITRRERDGDQVSKTSVKVYDVEPDAWGTPGFRILVEEDGTPRAEADVAAERERAEEARAKAAEEMARETPTQRAQREVRRRRALRDEEKSIEEAFTVVQARIVGREVVAGEPTVIVAFEPKDGAAPTTDVGRILNRTAGRVWFSERDHQLVRFDGAAVETVLYGWGLIARVHKGTRLVLERTRVDDLWLPKAYHLTGSARFVLFRSVTFDTESAFYGYQRGGTTLVATTP